MPLIRDGQIVENSWVIIDDEAELPSKGDITVSLDRLKNEADTLIARTGGLGIALENDVDEDEIETFLAQIDLITLTFPAFTDGRAYSQARQLRTKLGFEGELRAIGNVLADQAAFLCRVGFDSFEVDSSQSINVWNKALASMTVAYQRGYDGEQTTRTSKPVSHDKAEAPQA
jgi:uncharacterized protein (DUF934 family)